MGIFLGLMSGSKFFLESTNVDYQFLFWKYSPIFLFSIRPNFGLFWNFLGPLGLFLGSGSDSKTFVWKFSPTCLFLIQQHFGLFCTFWGPLGLYFWPFGAIFGVGVRSKYFFGTYLHSLTTFVLEVCGLLQLFHTFLGGWLD